MSRGRLVLSWFGRELAVIEAELVTREDGVREVHPVPEPAPIQTGVSGMADTALGEQADPDTKVMGFGRVLGPEKPDDSRRRRPPADASWAQTAPLRKDPS